MYLCRDKAQIRLRFDNRRGVPCVVTRSLSLTKTKTKLTFKALGKFKVQVTSSSLPIHLIFDFFCPSDAVVKSQNEKGETTSNSHKCADIDRLLPELLGISSAIMDSVVFCHQEDSSWPMQEGYYQSTLNYALVNHFTE